MAASNPFNDRPGVAPIDIRQGEALDETWAFQDFASGDPIDLSDVTTAYLQVRASLRTQPVIALSVGNGITLLPPHQLRIFIAPAQSDRLYDTRYLYDLVLGYDSGSQPRYEVRGQVNVHNTVTRIPSQ